MGGNVSFRGAENFAERSSKKQAQDHSAHNLRLLREDGVIDDVSMLLYQRFGRIDEAPAN